MTESPYRTDFPDITWLRSAIAERRSHGHGWPTIIHHVRTESQVRDNVDGPLSIFLNLRGTSTVEVDQHRRIVSDQWYTISNRRQIYTLDYQAPVETFNVHVADGMADAWFGAACSSVVTSLDAASSVAHELSFRPCTAAITPLMRTRLDALRTVASESTSQNMAVEEALVALLHCVTEHQHDLERRVAALPRLRPAVREEVIRRLLHARDAMHAYHTSVLSLDDLAGIACMSKYHFLRSFRQAFGCSPHQYIMQLRVGSAARLLEQSELPFSDIATRVGCESVSSFASTFKKITGRSPGVFRSARKEQFWRATAHEEQRRFASTMLN